MVELITVMVIAGVLAVVAIPLFFDNNTFQSRGFYDQVISTLRYAQKAAIAQRRFLCATFSANSVTLTYDPIPFNAITHSTAVCSGNLAGPNGQTPYAVDAPSGVTLSGSPFNFDALGKPSFATAQTITVSGYATAITIEAETGYVH